jgi:alcohol dehydrogenase class IV
MLFTTVPRLFCKPGARHEVGELISHLISNNSKQYAQSIVVVTDPGVRKLGLTKDVENCLEKHNIRAHVFDGVSEDPSESVILELVKFMTERNCTAVSV